MIEVKIPEGVEFTVSSNILRAKGKMGEVVREFKGASLRFSLDGNVLKVSSLDPAIERTAASHASIMCEGVLKGFEKKMVIRFAHFPITLETKGDTLLIKNFIGEKKPRRAKIIGKVKVDVKGQDIRISGPDKEAVGQTAANIRAATRIRDKDGRVFQDGIYIVG